MQLTDGDIQALASMHSADREAIRWLADWEYTDRQRRVWIEQIGDPTYTHLVQVHRAIFSDRTGQSFARLSAMSDVPRRDQIIPHIVHFALFLWVSGRFATMGPPKTAEERLALHVFSRSLELAVAEAYHETQ